MSLRIFCDAEPGKFAVVAINKEQEKVIIITGTCSNRITAYKAELKAVEKAIKCFPLVPRSSIFTDNHKVACKKKVKYLGKRANHAHRALNIFGTGYFEFQNGVLHPHLPKRQLNFLGRFFNQCFFQG